MNDYATLDEAIDMIAGLLRECYGVIDGCLCFAEKIHQASVVGGEAGVRAALQEMRNHLRAEVIATQEEYIRRVNEGTAARLAVPHH